MHTAAATPDKGCAARELAAHLLFIFVQMTFLYSRGSKGLPLDPLGECGFVFLFITVFRD